jgi:exodeoxyribonuclease VII small subunit
MAENKAATFEASLARLEAIVHKLESDQVALEDSVELFKEGRKLAAACEAMLKTAQAAIETVAAGVPEKEPSPAPFNASATSSLFDDDALA